MNCADGAETPPPILKAFCDHAPRRIGVKLSKFGKPQFVILARVAPPALHAAPNFGENV